MYIYNVTVNLEADIAEDWLVWMKTKHIPDVMSCGCFVSNKIFKVLVENEGATYSIQYYFKEMRDIENYQAHYAPKLQADHKSRYGEKALAFRTLLEVIE
jgi:hypothetical protein